MSDLLASLSDAVTGSPPVALAAAFVWGVLGILLSPCHLAGIPLLVAFIAGQEETGWRRAAALSSAFAAGMLITVALIGVVTASAGRVMGDVGRYGYWLVALVFILAGLHLLGVIPLSWTRPRAPVWARRGLFAAFALGLILGVALGPCTFAFMAPMLGVVFTVGASSATLGFFLLLAYGIGHGGVLVLAGAGAGWVQRYLDWQEGSRKFAWLRRLCGVLVILGGLYLLNIAP